jgi:hypothetical protein
MSRGRVGTPVTPPARAGSTSRRTFLLGAVAAGTGAGVREVLRRLAGSASVEGPQGASVLGDPADLGRGPIGVDTTVAPAAPAPAMGRYLPREEWQTAPIDFKDMDGGGKGTKMVFIHHTTYPSDRPAVDPAQHMRSIERDHQHRPDDPFIGVGYSFVVFPDGTVAEGRGWGKVGAHTVAAAEGEERNLSKEGYGIALDGDFTATGPPQVMVDAVVATICAGIAAGYIAPDAQIFGHRDANRIAGLPGEPSTCPGDVLYSQLGAIREAVGRYAAAYIAGQRPDPGIDLGR